MDFDKKVGVDNARAAKAIGTGQSLNLKLLRLINGAQPNKTALAVAQQQNLEDKLQIIVRAQRDFTVTLSDIDSKTEAMAAHMRDVAEPALATLKEHCASFEMILNLAKNYLSTVD